MQWKGHQRTQHENVPLYSRKFFFLKKLRIEGFIVGDEFRKESSVFGFWAVQEGEFKAYLHEEQGYWVVHSRSLIRLKLFLRPKWWQNELKLMKQS